LGKSAGSAKGKPKIEAYDKDRKKGAVALITPAKVRNWTSICTVKPLYNNVIHLSPYFFGCYSEMMQHIIYNIT